MATALDNLEANAITVEVQRADVRQLHLQQVRLTCPWCDKRHVVVQDRGTEASGYMCCGGCGEFFRWFASDRNAATRRVRARPKPEKSYAWHPV